MTTIVYATQPQKMGRLPEFALVLGLSVAGLMLSLSVAIAIWTDGPIVGF